MKDPVIEQLKEVKLPFTSMSKQRRERLAARLVYLAARLVQAN